MKKSSLFPALVLIAALFITSDLLAQTYEVENSGMLNLSSSSFNGTITSTTQNTFSTALLNFMPASSSLDFSGDLSSYYGQMTIANGKTINFNTNSGGYAYLNGDFYPSPTYLNILETTQFSGSSGQYTMLLAKNFNLNIAVTKSLKLTNALYVDKNGTDNLNHPKISMYKNAVDNENEIGSHIEFDNLTSVTGTLNAADLFVVNAANLATDGLTPGTQYTLTLAKGSTNLVISGNPTINDLDLNVWEGITTDYTQGVKVGLTFAPLFGLTGGGYYGNWANLLSNAGNTGASATVYRNHTMTEGYTADKDFKLIIYAGKTFATTSNYELTISDGKSFVISGTGNGVFTGKLAFGGTASRLVFVGENKLTGDISIGGNSSGTIVIGDGTEHSNQWITPEIKTSFNNKVDKIVVKGNSEVYIAY